MKKIKVLTPQEYLESIGFEGQAETISDIYNVLDKRSRDLDGVAIWDYPVEELNYIIGAAIWDYPVEALNYLIEDEIDVVLVYDQTGAVRLFEKKVKGVLN